jgi:hypothetical protein
MTCSFEKESRFNVDLDDFDDKKSMNVAANILKTLASLEDDIAQCERQIAVSQPPLQKQYTVNRDEIVDKSWEIIIKKSSHQKMKLEIQIQSAAGWTSLLICNPIACVISY